MARPTSRYAHCVASSLLVLVPNQIIARVTQSCIYLLLATSADGNQLFSLPALYFFLLFVQRNPSTFCFPDSRSLASKSLFVRRPPSRQTAAPPPPAAPPWLRGKQAAGGDFRKDPLQANIREILFATEINLPTPSQEI